jgi:hypothetical protein
LGERSVEGPWEGEGELLVLGEILGEDLELLEAVLGGDFDFEVFVFPPLGEGEVREARGIVGILNEGGDEVTKLEGEGLREGDSVTVTVVDVVDVVEYVEDEVVRGGAPVIVVCETDLGDPFRGGLRDFPPKTSWSSSSSLSLRVSRGVLVTINFMLLGVRDSLTSFPPLWSGVFWPLLLASWLPSS